VATPDRSLQLPASILFTLLTSRGVNGGRGTGLEQQQPPSSTTTTGGPDWTAVQTGFVLFKYIIIDYQSVSSMIDGAVCERAQDARSESRRHFAAVDVARAAMFARAQRRPEKTEGRSQASLLAPASGTIFSTSSSTVGHPIDYSPPATGRARWCRKRPCPGCRLPALTALPFAQLSKIRHPPCTNLAGNDRQNWQEKYFRCLRPHVGQHADCRQRNHGSWQVYCDCPRLRHARQWGTKYYCCKCSDCK
jgi:hypothetical protein